MTNKEKSQIQKEIIDSLTPKPYGRLLLAPRVGKTKMMIDLIKREKPEAILWVTPSSELALNAIPEEFAFWKAKRYIKKLTTVTWMSLAKTEGTFDMVILDEEQYITEANIQNFINGKLKFEHIISMTGTQTKHESKKDLYEMLGLKILVDLSINSAVDLGVLADYKISVLEIPMSTEKDIEAGNPKNRFMTSEVSQYSWLNRSAEEAMMNGDKNVMFKIFGRLRAIYNSPSKTKVAKMLTKYLPGKNLVFCGSIKQAEEVCENTYHSKTDNKNLLKFQNGEIDKISMVNSGGVGTTYKKIDNLIIAQVDSDKTGKTSQKICRALLSQKNYQAHIWIICLMHTQDKKWINAVLQNFDSSKVEYLKLKDLNDEFSNNFK